MDLKEAIMRRFLRKLMNLNMWEGKHTEIKNLQKALPDHLRGTKEMKKEILFWILFLSGLFLFLDGILSVWFGNECLNNCLNNNTFGNVVRIIRGGIGVVLIVLAFIRK